MDNQQQKVCERTAPLTRSTDSGAPTVEPGKVLRLSGVAVSYGKRSALIHEFGERFYEIIDAGAFAASIASRNVTLTFLHKDESEYGDTDSGTLELRDSAEALTFSLLVPPYAHTLRKAIQTKAVRGMSFGFIPQEVYTDADGVRHIKRAELLHISPVYSPAYDTGVPVLEHRNNLDVKKKKLQVLELDTPAKQMEAN